MTFTYREHGFQIFRNVFEGAGLVAIQNLFNYQLFIEQMGEEDELEIGDGQVARRTAFGRTNFGDAILYACKPLIQEAAGCEILPTYSYPVLNLPGSVLKRHTDREACEFTATVTIQNDPDVPWPLYAQTPDRVEHEILLNAGDMAFYDGITCDHWRDGLPNDHYNFSIFLHYVRADGKYANWHDREKVPEFAPHDIRQICKKYV